MSSGWKRRFDGWRWYAGLALAAALAVASQQYGAASTIPPPRLNPDQLGVRWAVGAVPPGQDPASHSASSPTADTAEGTTTLMGNRLASAIGGYRYTWHADGSIEPDPAWVAANIRTESVPILGAVTGHRLVFPQLRAAMHEIEAMGLQHLIHPRDFGGCYVPRFIDRDPSKPLSWHAFGVAIDLNVADNQLGTVGRMDPRIVAIFARWGFAWGGLWERPDPMHFELAVVLNAK